MYIYIYIYICRHILGLLRSVLCPIRSCAPAISQFVQWLRTYPMAFGFMMQRLMPAFVREAKGLRNPQDWAWIKWRCSYIVFYIVVLIVSGLFRWSEAHIAMSMSCLVMCVPVLACACLACTCTWTCTCICTCACICTCMCTSAYPCTWACTCTFTCTCTCACTCIAGCGCSLVNLCTLLFERWMNGGFVVCCNTKGSVMTHDSVHVHVKMHTNLKNHIDYTQLQYGVWRVVRAMPYLLATCASPEGVQQHVHCTAVRSNGLWWLMARRWHGVCFALLAWKLQLADTTWMESLPTDKALTL